MKLFGSTKNYVENLPSRGVVEVVFAQCNLVDSRNQQTLLYTCIPNNSYAYLLNVEPSNLVFLKTNNTELDEIIIIFKYQNG